MSLIIDGYKIAIVLFSIKENQITNLSRGAWPRATHIRPRVGAHLCWINIHILIYEPENNKH